MASHKHKGTAGSRSIKGSILIHCISFITNFPFTENVVGEPAKRSVRSNRGVGGHAYQLEKALEPQVQNNKASKKDRIPDTVPENAMAPQVLRQMQIGNNLKTVTIMILPFK
jgi:hypothetical protein